MPANSDDGEGTESITLRVPESLMREVDAGVEKQYFRNRTHAFIRSLTDFIEQHKHEWKRNGAAPIVPKRF